MGTKPEIKKVDKSEWPRGPWDREPDRLEFEAHGMSCLLTRGPGGHWCGYAAMPPGHPGHGQHYDHEVFSDVRVHGGLTYSEKCQGAVCHVPKPGEPDDVWWVGFDCAHSGDLSPAHMKYGRSWDDGEYRDIEWVKTETGYLARQLAEISKGGDPANT